VGLSDYETQPREYVLSSISTTIEVDARISDLFRSPMEQVKEQLTLTVEKLKEKQRTSCSTTAAMGSCTMPIPTCASSRAKARRRRTIWTS